MNIDENKLKELQDALPNLNEKNMENTNYEFRD